MEHLIHPHEYLRKNQGGRPIPPSINIPQKLFQQIFELVRSNGLVTLFIQMRYDNSRYFV